MPAPYERRMRLIPGGCSAAANGPGTGQAARPPVMSCTPWGFSCPGACAPGGGLLPRLFTLAGPRPRALDRRFIFCDTFRHPRLGPGGRPRLLRGMAPCGVRTFLPAAPSAAGRSSALREKNIPPEHDPDKGKGVSRVPPRARQSPDWPPTPSLKYPRPSPAKLMGQNILALDPYFPPQQTDFD